MNRLNHLVDELLLLARFENQKQSLKIERVSLNALFLDTISRNTTIISEKKLNCDALFANDFYVETDSYLFSIVVNNILTNAVKYSKTNSKIHFEIQEIDHKIVCTISDNGIGIAPEDLEKYINNTISSNNTSTATTENPILLVEALFGCDLFDSKYAAM